LDPQDSRGNVFRVAVALLCGTLVFVAFVLPDNPFALSAAMPWRAVFAGLVVGLVCLDRLPASAVAAIAVIDALFGSVLLVVMLAGSFDPLPMVLTLVACGAVAAGTQTAARRVGRRLVAGIALLVVVVGYVWSAGLLGGSPSFARVSSMQQLGVLTGAGSFDGCIYTQTAVAVKDGSPYYASFAKAYHADKRALGPLSSVFKYREPYLFWFWRLLPGNGVEALWWYSLALGLLVLLASYSLAARFLDPGAALVAPMLVLPVMTSALWSNWFMFTEVWAGAVVVFAMLAVLRRRWLLGAILLAAAVGFRELAVVVVPAFVLAWTLYPQRRDEIAALVVAVLGPVALLGAHMLMAPLERGPGAAGALAVSQWMHGGIEPLRQTLAFGTGSLGGAPVLIWVAPLAAVAGGILLRPSWRAALVVASVIGALSFLFVFHSSVWGDYWGALLTPLDFTLLVLALAPLAPSAFPPDTAKTRDAPRKVRIVLPAYNEESSIGELLERIGAVMKQCKLPYAVLVMDDASTDATATVARSLAGRFPVTVATNPKNLGLGGNIARGLRAAVRGASDNDVIVTLDADLTQDPRYIPSMVDAYRAGADVVIASRFRHGSRVRGVSPLRRLMTRGARFVLSSVLYVEGVRDYSCGYRLYAAPVLRDAFDDLGSEFIHESGFACMAEILLKLRHRARFAEVPFELHYEEKRKASAMRVGRTAASYFEVAARVRWLELTERAA
jgi:dolichol-phosphate mannosyltransferase